MPSQHQVATKVYDLGIGTRISVGCKSSEYLMKFAVILGRPSLSTFNMPSLPTEPPRTIAPTPPAPKLSIPRPPNLRPSAPKIKLQINAPATGGSLFQNYAGGPSIQGLQTDPRSDYQIIQPECLTRTPAHRQTTAFDDLRELVAKLEAARAGVPSSTRAHSRQTDSEDFSDVTFEVLDFLGEGTGSEVHKVRHPPTGRIMA